MRRCEIDSSVIRLIGEIPLHAGAMDVLRTGISALAHIDPQSDENDRDANIAKTIRLLARIPILIACRYRQVRGLEVIAPNPQLSFAANLLYMITGNEPTPLQERAMDVSLILYAEHEFNASTFASRVVTSTQSDLYSAITAAVGTLKGPLHGGANERVMQVLKEVGTSENADEWVRNALAEKRRVMGFGHRVYKTGDPRATVLREYCLQLAKETGSLELEKIADTIEAVIREEKGLPPNLDWPSARLYHYLGLEVELYTPLFVASRVVGWAAHVIEQSENNRLIRPRSRYIGPDSRNVVPYYRLDDLFPVIVTSWQEETVSKAALFARAVRRLGGGSECGEALLPSKTMFVPGKKPEVKARCFAGRPSSLPTLSRA